MITLAHQDTEHTISEELNAMVRSFQFLKYIVLQICPVY
jgi:hypothetical protein